MPELSKEQRLRDLMYHSVSQSTATKMAVIRKSYYKLGEEILDSLPDSRERSLALTALEESSMRAIQCLAVLEGKEVPVGETSNTPHGGAPSDLPGAST